MPTITESEFTKLIESLPEGDQQAIKETISELRALNFVNGITFNEVHTVAIEVLTDDDSLVNREKSRKIHLAEYNLLRKLEGSLNVRLNIITDDECI